MRKLVLLVAAALFAFAQVGDAQVIPLHNHPQLAAYASPADWPVDSSQCHWRPGSGMPEVPSLYPLLPVGLSIANPTIAHTHLDCAIPRYGEIGAPIAMSCTIKAFHTDGTVGDLISPLGQIRDVIYADTGTSTAPDMRGDPMGLKQWNVRFVFDPLLRRMDSFPQVSTVPLHGWFQFQVGVTTFYANGDKVPLVAIRSLYSVEDLTAPEQPWTGEGPSVATACAPNTLRRQELNIYGNQMGEVFSSYVGLLPVAPIQAPWTTRGFFYAYAQLEGIPGFQFPDGTFSLRRDVDIHNGIPGVDIAPPQHFQGNASFLSFPITFDPAVIGSGTHNIVAFWQEPDGQGNDNTALQVFNLTVGPGVPPPPPPTLCTDPTATNTGMPLPCVYPPPPPPPPPTTCEVAGAINLHGPLPCVFPPPPPAVTWLDTPLGFQRQLINGVPQNVFRFCLSTQCFTFPATPIP